MFGYEEENSSNPLKIQESRKNFKYQIYCLIAGVPVGISSIPEYPGYTGLRGDSYGDDIGSVSTGDNKKMTDHTFLCFNITISKLFPTLTFKHIY